MGFKFQTEISHVSALTQQSQEVTIVSRLWSHPTTFCKMLYLLWQKRTQVFTCVHLGVSGWNNKAPVWSLLRIGRCWAVELSWNLYHSWTRRMFLPYSPLTELYLFIRADMCARVFWEIFMNMFCCSHKSLHREKAIWCCSNENNDWMKNIQQSPPCFLTSSKDYKIVETEMTVPPQTW